MTSTKKLSATLLTILTTQPAFAAGGGTMPWDAPLQKIATALSGPTAISVAIIAMVVTALVIAFAGDLPEWGKRLAIMCLAVSVAVGASNLLLNLFNVGAGVM